MSRIQPAFPAGEDFGALDQSTRVQLGVGGIMAHRPEIAQGLGAFTERHQPQRDALATADRTDPPPDRVPQPVPELHGDPLRRGRERRRQRGPRLLARTARGGGGSHACRTRRAPLRRPVRDQPPRDRRRRLRRSPAVLHRGRARGDRAQLRARRRRRSPGRDLVRGRRPAGAVPRRQPRSSHRGAASRWSFPRSGRRLLLLGGPATVHRQRNTR